MTEANIKTNTTSTWCPGCFNFMIQAGVEQFLKDKDTSNFAIVSGIGCHAKIFDYINLPGLNTLHGRVIPTCMGMKIAKPDLNVMGFSGDGDSFDEGMSHLVHAARYNSNFTYMIHNNQVFALTVAQPTPVTEQGYVDKITPFGVKLSPMNPLKLMLAAGAGFVARVYADVTQVKEILEEAHKHKGFKFIEIMQPCIIFHKDIGYKDRTYNIQEKGHDKTNLDAAMKLAEEYDYNNPEAKIPLGIFYQAEKPVFEDLIREKK